MCIVDTSVWISLFCQRQSPLGRLLIELSLADEVAICGQVYLEFVGGFSSDERRSSAISTLEPYVWVTTPPQAWQLAAELFARHRHIGPGDAIIAATCIAHEVELLTLDEGFDQLRPAGLKLRSIS